MTHWPRDYHPRDPDYHQSRPVSAEIAGLRRKRRHASAILWLVVAGFAALAILAAALACGWPTA